MLTAAGKKCILKGYLYSFSRKHNPFSLYPKRPWWKIQDSDTSFPFISQLISQLVQPSSAPSPGGRSCHRLQGVTQAQAAAAALSSLHGLITSGAKRKKQLFRKCGFIPVTSLNFLTVFQRCWRLNLAFHHPELRHSIHGCKATGV